MTSEIGIMLLFLTLSIMTVIFDVANSIERVEYNEKDSNN